MNGFDIFIGLITIFFMIRGFMKGFVSEFFQLIALFFSFYFSVKFYPFISKFFLKYVSTGVEFLNISAFLIIFFGTFTIFFIIKTYLLPVEKVFLLKTIDKLMGAISGFLIGTLITYGIGYLIMFFYKPLIIQNSKIFPYYERIMKYIFHKLI